MKKIITFFVFIILIVLINQSIVYAKMIMVDKEKANIKYGPGKKYEILWSAVKYTPFEVLCKYKKWYVIRDFEGDIGWIYETLARKEKAVIIKKKKAEIESKPGKSFDILWKVEKGYPFKVIEQKDKWLKVVDSEGDSGWVYKDSVWGLTIE